ncbi:MAG: hypothetical protein DRJ67_12575 [Thermoprotei archaeon]|nr:MAG: hypothetical protein DRJ67_12575 [Thermoprotei archaeon]
MDFNRIMREIEEVSRRIEERIKELGDGDPVSMRHDPVIARLKARLCMLHERGLRACGMCSELARVLPVVEKLYLSEEEPCCLKLLRRLRSEQAR